MRTIYRIGIICTALLAFACKSPLDKEFERETAEADYARIVRMGLIDSTDAYIMSHFMVEHELIGAQVLELDATYRDILNESKKFWDESQEKKGEHVDKTSQEGLENDLRVSLQPLGSVQQSEWSHGIKYKLILENTSGKTIRAVKGNFGFFDPFGDQVYSIEYKFLDPVAAGEKVERTVTLRIQNTASPQLLLEYGQINPFVVRWEPVRILFQE